jgi:penicillin amidase
MKKILKGGLLSILFILLGFLIFLFILMSSSVPGTKGRISLKGLTSEVRITIDAWGVPHIFAQDEKDLFFACGYMHARERMWQMELSRRAGFGRLSEIFGRRALEQDRFMRNIGLKEAARKDFEKLSSRMKELLISYTNGVNSWMSSRGFNWPPEFLLLRCRPYPWSPMDSLVVKESMALLLCADYQSEALRANLVKRLGPQKALQILEEGIVEAPSETEDASFAEGSALLPSQGSNNWVLAGRRTESGKPLLANDPHLNVTLPPVWYEIHLISPGFNVTGVSLPGIPLIIIGHNESIAWGITNSGADVQDLYLEKIDPSGENYLDKNEWKPLLKKEEIIRIKGEGKQERMEISWTARGPIVSPSLIKSRHPLSLSWTIYEGGLTFESFYLLNKAQNWQEFKAALKLFDAPSQNFVYADRQGNIGYYLSGKIPLRPEAAALFPFPGWKEEGSWTGFLKEEEKPALYNPEQGFIITANNKIVAGDFPHYLSVDWEAPFRAERIKELLLQREKHSVETFKKIQSDVFSKKGELILPYITKTEEAEGKAKEAIRILKGWDLLLSSGKEAALYKAFENFFHEEVFKDDLGDDFQSFDSLFRRKRAGLLRILSDPLSPWFDKKDTPEKETREEMIEVSLERAYEWLEKKYGPPEKWDWLRMNSLYFRHLLGGAPLLRFFNRGPFPMSGDSSTVRVYSSSRKGSLAASYRQIIDLSDFRNSVCVLSSGESGHFKSRFYDDQIPLWLEGRYHPMLFAPEDIEANSSGILVLKPLIKEKNVP